MICGGKVKRYLIFALLLVVMLFPAITEAVDLEKDLSAELWESHSLVERASQKLRAGIVPAEEAAKLGSLAERVRASHLVLKERFDGRQKQAASLSSRAADRNGAMTDAYTTKIEGYLKLVDSILSDGVLSAAELGDIGSYLEQIVIQHKRPTFGTLPYKNLGYPAKEPTTAPVVVPAYRGGSRTVTADDTKITPEAPLSKEIKGLAQSLQWNPVLIYEWVKNNVETEWYWGSMKGAEETLRQKSGNDADQATLLTALLRASGFPTRYVQGTIEFFPDIDKVKNLTGIDDPIKIAAFFQKAGIPFKPVIVGGKIVNFQIEHLWVESEIPYSNYRGAVIDDLGKTWLALDTSVKPSGYSRKEGKPLQELSLDTLRNEYLETPNTLTPLEFIKAKTEDYLAVNAPDTAWNDLKDAKSIVPEVLSIIPAGLQFAQVSITGEYASIPDELKHKVVFSATVANNELFTATRDASELSNRKVTLTYEPESVEDQQIIDSYGGLDNTPSYLVRLRPVLTVDGERIVVARDGLPMGAEYSLAISVISPNGTEQVSNTHIVGNLSVIGIVSHKTTGDTALTENDDAGTILFKEVNGYIRRWNQAEEELAALLKVAMIRPVPTVVTVGGVIDVTWLLGLPHGFEWKGVFIDAALRGVEAVPRTSDGTAVRTFMRLCSLQGSVLENRIFEDDFQVESVSTAKLLALAANSAVPLVTIDQANSAAVLPSLTVGEEVKQDIVNAVNQGLTVTIPQHDMTYREWSGIGYLKENPVTGASGWMLSGQIAGGMTVVGTDRWNEIFRNPLSQPFTEPANLDPASAASIQKITASDLQFGLVGEPLKSPLQVLVRDRNGKPVAKAEVIFTVRAGGGKFADGQTTITVQTGKNGVASAVLTLGQLTAANPVFMSDENDRYSNQYGQNVVDAELASGVPIAAPFTAYGMPKEPQAIRQTHGDGSQNPILSFAGFVSVAVEDMYGNPIANQPVTFSVGKAVDRSGCSNPNNDTRPAVLLTTADPCIKSSPIYSELGKCGTAASALTGKTSSTGAAVQVVLGGIPGADYPIEAKALVETTAGNKELTTTFTLKSYPFGNCSGFADPSYQFTTSYVYPADAYGNNINAAKAGTAIPVQAKLYFLKENPALIEETFNCDSGSLTCKKIAGAREYVTTTDFTSSSVTFGGVAGESQGEGVFTSSYTLKPGLNYIQITGSAGIGIQYTDNTCTGGCSGVLNRTLTLDGVTAMEVYGVDVDLKIPKMVQVTKEGYSSNDLILEYTIAPAEYLAMRAAVLIYKGSELVAYIPSELQNAGHAVVSRGFKFDMDSTYSAQVVLNYGTGVEIRSDRVPLALAGPSFAVQRVHQLSQFDATIPTTIGSSYTDSYREFFVKLPGPSTVNVKLLAADFSEHGTIVQDASLAAGEHRFVVDYDLVQKAGFSSTLLPLFYLQVIAAPADGSPVHKIIYPGQLIERVSGRMLGQTIVHDVLIQDGSLNLTRQDFAFNGRGPQLAFTRNYTNLSSSAEQQALGEGWSHSLDMRLYPISSQLSGTDSVPDWVKNVEGRFYTDADVPKTPFQWTVVFANGNTFKKYNGVWYSERGRHGTLTESNGSFIYTAKDGTRYYYDYPGMKEPTPVRAVEDRNGNRMAFTYDASDRLATVSDAVGRMCRFGYDPIPGLFDIDNTRLTSVSCPDGVEVTFTYNSRGYLTKATRGNRVETYDYAPEPGIVGSPLNLVKTTDANSHSHGYEYHNAGELHANLGNFVKALKAQDVVKRVKYPDDTKGVLFTYDVQTANTRKVTDLRDKDTVYTLNYYGNPVKIEEPLGKTTLMTWSIDESKPDNVMTSKTDPRGYTTIYEYDARGNVTRETDPYGKSIVTAWNQQFSFPELRTDRNLVVERWSYDPANGNLLWREDGDLKRTTYTYYPTGERQTATDPSQKTTAYTWDQWGNPDTVIGAEGSKTDYDYDIRGRLAAATDPNGKKTTYTYDPLDYPATILYPSFTTYPLADGSSTTKTFLYDPVGNLLEETDRVGLKFTYIYTSRDQVKEITRSTGGKKSFDYDPNGNLTSESDWKGIATTHTYDDLNRRASTTNRLGHTMLMAYDLNGNLTETTDYEGRKTTQEYDKLNRLIDTWQPPLPGEERGNIHYTYYNEADPKTNLKTETDQENHTTTYEYNGRYLRTKRINATLVDTFRWEYDDSGNLKTEIDEENRTVRHEYDGQNRRSATIHTVNGVEQRTRYLYDLAGNRTHVIDPRPLKNDTETRYDDWNRAWKVIDPDKYEKTVELDGEGREVKSSDGNNHVRTKLRDKRGLVMTATDAEGHDTGYTYDLNGNLETVTDALGTITKTTYDAEDRKLLTTEALGQPEERTTGVILYDKVGNPLQVRDGNGNIRKTEYNILNLPWLAYDPAPFDGQFTETTYYKTGTVKSVRNHRGYLTAYEYDELNRLKKVTDPRTKTIETTYDKVGNIKTVKDKRGILTENDYDELNRLKETRRAGIRLVTNDYDEAGNLRFVTDAKGYKTEHTYTGRGLLDTTIYPDSTTRKRSYDGAGNLLTETDEEEKVTTYGYDKENRQTSVEFAGETTGKRYNDVGSLVEIIKPEGTSRAMEYDPLKRLAGVTEGGLTTRYEYDTNNNLRHQFDPRENQVEYTWDELNRKKEQIQHKASGNLVTQFVEYDAEGNLARLIDPKGQEFTYVYDELNRKIDEQLPQAATPYLTLTTVHTEYDGNNNVTGISETKRDTQGATITDTTVNTYDDFDRVKTSTQRGLTVTYDYDNNGNRTSVATAAGATTYTFDTRNRVETATEVNRTTGFTYYPDGKKKTISYPNGASTTYTYKPTNRTATVENTSGATLISRFSYDYDRNGNRTSQSEERTNGTETTSYHYDTLDRLDSYTVTNGSDTTTTDYTFEGYNRKTETVTQNGLTLASRRYDYDETDWLTVIDAVEKGLAKSIHYDYDNNGNTIRKSDSTKPDEDTLFAYDTKNRLVRTTRGATLLGLYDYNAQGYRIRHKGSERGDVDYYYDGTAIIEERTNGALLAHYRYAGKALSLMTPTSTQYYHLDALGSTVDLTDSTGTTKVSYTLDPWGHIRNQIGESVNRQIFTGQEHDTKTNLIYFGARYYDPDTARFISQDSYLGEQGTPPSLNRYLYAYSNPTVYVDLLGYASEEPSAWDRLITGAQEAWKGTKTAISKARKALPVISREVNEVPKKVADSFTPETTTGQLFATALYTTGEFINGNVMAPVSAAGAVEEASENPTKVNVGLAILATSPYAPKGSGKIVKKLLGKEAVAGEKLLTKEARSGANVVEKEAVEEVVAKGIANEIPSAKGVDFYVSPGGQAIPSRGYRALSGESNIAEALEGTISSRNPTYITFDNIRGMKPQEVQSLLQLPKTPSHAVQFDTLQLLDDLSIPTGKWNTTNVPEPITTTFPKWGKGGGTQAITNQPISINDLWRLSE